mmetsp:Transcript_40860/g.113614  ORF Transcript_40860/g.113614 Transcript_40860/m.113614 type:complete len:230 (+) Transcript_40860:713-1402(+)
MASSNWACPGSVCLDGPIFDGELAGLISRLKLSRPRKASCAALRVWLTCCVSVLRSSVERASSSRNEATSVCKDASTAAAFSAVARLISSCSNDVCSAISSRRRWTASSSSCLKLLTLRRLGSSTDMLLFRGVKNESLSFDKAGGRAPREQPPRLGTALSSIAVSEFAATSAKGAVVPDTDGLCNWLDNTSSCLPSSSKSNIATHPNPSKWHVPHIAGLAFVPNCTKTA